jgi:hypothetical protein
MFRCRPLVGYAALLAVFALGRGLPAASQADRSVPFKVGETLSYDVSWSMYMSAGTATLAVKERRPVSASAAAYDLVADGRPIGLVDTLYHAYYKAESLLDTRTLQPVMTTLFSEEGKRRNRRLTRFTGRTSIEFQPEENAPVEKLAVPESSRDPLSTLYFLRAQQLKSGQAFAMPIVDGSDVYNTQWRVSGPEPFSSNGTTTTAWRLSPTFADDHNRPIPSLRLTLWITNDARRLPIKLEVGLPVGTFVLTLTKATG